MVGQKQHDTNQFIDKAMRTFWAHGYEGTSINDLVKATGVNRGSIYANFDGKRGIFLAALDRYEKFYSARFLAAISEMPDPKEAIIAAFEAAAKSDDKSDQPAGCLIVNTAVECAPHDPAISVITRESLGNVEVFFKKQLSAAMQSNCFVGQIDPGELAKSLLASFMGLRVLTRSGAPQTTRDSIVAQTRALLA